MSVQKMMTYWTLQVPVSSRDNGKKIGWFFLLGFTSGDHYHGNGLFPYFPLSREIQVERNTKSFKKCKLLLFDKNSIIIASGISVLHVKGYRSKFADGRRRLRNIQQQRSVRSPKETMPYYNKQRTNLTCSRLYWR